MQKLLSQTSIKNKIVLLRLDLNVPVFENKILSDFRITKSLKTIQDLLDNNNRIIILSHFGRPIEGQYDSKYSLKRVSDRLQELLSQKVMLVKNWTDGVKFDDETNIIMCENVRFEVGEKENSLSLSKKIASLGDVFIFDAFGVSHRKEASSYGVSDYLDTYAGHLLESEIINAKKLLSAQTRPLTTIISGAKISTKLTLIKKLILKSDHIILGGGILNTFLSAMGNNIGNSLVESSFINEAKEILNGEHSKKIIMPIDVVSTDSLSLDNPKNKKISMLQSNDKILDIGEKTTDRYIDIIRSSKTVFWNGPLGYIEKKPYDNGTIKISEAIASSETYSIVGGGDTIPVIEKLGLQNDFSYLSTGGGSLLKFIEGEDMPILTKLGMI